MFRTARLIASDLRAKAEWCYESRRFGAVCKVLLTDGTPAMIWFAVRPSLPRVSGSAELSDNPFIKLIPPADPAALATAITSALTARERSREGRGTSDRGVTTPKVLQCLRSTALVARVRSGTDRSDRERYPAPTDPAIMIRFFRLVYSDLRAKAAYCYARTDWKGFLKVAVTDGTAAMIWYRLMQWARRWWLIPLEMICNKLNAICCNCIIGRGAEFGPGFVLIHSTGVVINGMVRAGSNFHVYHQVTLGATPEGVPVIGNDVFIGAGAKVFGPVTIGDGARVGANAVVLHDVPPHVTVVGIPAKIVRRRTPDGSVEPPPAEVPLIGTTEPPQTWNDERGV